MTRRLYWTDGSGCLSLRISLADAESACHSGDCSADVQALRETAGIARQVDAWDADTLRETLAEYGAWDAAELADDEQNRLRMLWIACGDVTENPDDYR